MSLLHHFTTLAWNGFEADQSHCGGFVDNIKDTDMTASDTIIFVVISGSADSS